MTALNCYNVKSVTKVLATLPEGFKGQPWKDFITAHFTFPNDDPVWWQRYADWMDGRVKNTSDEEDFTFVFAGHIHEFLKTRDIYDDIVLYEDLKKDAESKNKQR